VPSQTRTKAAAGGAKVKSKSGRRSPVNVRVKKGSDLPFLPIAVGAILVALFIGLGIYGYLNNGSNKPAVVAGIPCDALQHSQVHYHAALQIVYQGVVTPIPAGIGITGGETTPSCFYWLHVHGASENVIHIESPANQTFTLGDFFKVWNAWQVAAGGSSVPFDATHVATFTLTAGQKLVVYVDANDGKGSQPYTGDPKKIVLQNHKVITLEITPPAVTPPPTFTWPAGL
jgi:hypothetical protein